MKNALRRPIDGERCTAEPSSADLNAFLPPAFQISDLELCEFGSKRATFAIGFFGGALIVGGELFDPHHSAPFVQPASIRNRYSGQYERTVRWAPALASEILAVVLRELDQLSPGWVHP